MCFSNLSLSASNFEDAMVEIISNDHIFYAPQPTQIHRVLHPHGEFLEGQLKNFLFIVQIKKFLALEFDYEILRK